MAVAYIGEDGFSPMSIYHVFRKSKLGSAFYQEFKITDGRHFFLLNFYLEFCFRKLQTNAVQIMIPCFLKSGVGDR